MIYFVNTEYIKENSLFPTLTDCGHDEIRTIYRDEFVDHGISRDFPERA